MKPTKFHWIILAINILNLLLFSFFYLRKQNYEFVIYIVVIIFFLILISLLHLKYNFSKMVLVGMTIWAILHMSGGFFIINNAVLYSYQIIPRFLRFDQLVHFFGFGIATLLSFEILKQNLKIKSKLALSIFIIFIGMGIGALNEIIEFIAVLTVPQTGVGGYENTMWDMVFNTFGAILAVLYLNLSGKMKNIKS